MTRHSPSFCVFWTFAFKIPQNREIRWVCTRRIWYLLSKNETRNFVVTLDLSRQFSTKLFDEDFHTLETFLGINCSINFDSSTQNHGRTMSIGITLGYTIPNDSDSFGFAFRSLYEFFSICFAFLQAICAVQQSFFCQWFFWFAPSLLECFLSLLRSFSGHIHGALQCQFNFFLTFYSSALSTLLRLCSQIKKIHCYFWI